MKKFILGIVVIGLATGLFISDRDRGMWLLNSAIGLVEDRSVVTDIAYGEQPWQTLDVYPASSDSPAPVVVFIYGGSWKHGRKEQYFFAADAFIRLGYTVVVADYPKYPSEEARYPQFVVDAAKSLKWVKQNIPAHNGNPEQVFVAGHSAGAHTAIMLAVDAQYLEQQGLQPSDIKGVAGIAGPYSFVPNRKHTMAVFGPPQAYPKMDALNYVNGDEPPTLLLHSEADEQVGQHHQEKLAAEYKRIGQPIVTHLYREISHIEIVLQLHPWFARETDIAGDIDNFFRAQLAAGSVVKQRIDEPDQS